MQYYLKEHKRYYCTFVILSEKIWTQLRAKSFQPPIAPPAFNAVRLRHNLTALCESCGKNAVCPTCGEPGNGDDAMCVSVGPRQTAHTFGASEAHMLRSLPRKNLLTYFSGSCRNRL